MPSSELVQSVVRALDLLNIIAAYDNGMRLNDIAEASGLKTTTAHNLLRSLAARGFVEKESNGAYVIGPAVYELANRNDMKEIVTNAAILLPQVAKKLPHAVLTFSCMSPNTVRCILRMSPERPGQVQRPSELVFQPYISATAICLQATAPNAVHYEQNWTFDECGAKRWKSIGEFIAVKNKVRQDGFYANTADGHVAAAFAVCENYALGIRMDSSDGTFATIANAASFFIDAIN